MPRTVRAYQCVYCGTLKKTLNICIRHEEACLENPECRNCTLCKHREFIQDKNARTGNQISWCPKMNMKCSVALSAACDLFEKVSK